MIALLKLLEQVGEAATDDASRRTAGEQAAKGTLEQIAETATAGQAGTFRVLPGEGAGAAGLLPGWAPLNGLVCKQYKNRHSHRRHAATIGVGVGWAVWSSHRSVCH
jgi:hypothetical protein